MNIVLCSNDELNKMDRLYKIGAGDNYVIASDYVEAGDIWIENNEHYEGEDCAQVVVMEMKRRMRWLLTYQIEYVPMLGSIAAIINEVSI